MRRWNAAASAPTPGPRWYSRRESFASIPSATSVSSRWYVVATGMPSASATSRAVRRRRLGREVVEDLHRLGHGADPRRLARLFHDVKSDFISRRPRLALARRERQSGRARRRIGGVSESKKTPSELIDERIQELGDWRGELLGRLRALIHEADPEIVEEWKWRGVPTWYHDGMVCTGETYKEVVKLTFAKGAALDDPAGLFNSSLEGNTRRAIDIREGEAVDEAALKALVRAAVALNEARAR